MSDFTPITGHQARGLIDKSTPGPWTTETYAPNPDEARSTPDLADDPAVTAIGPIRAAWMNCGPDACIDAAESDRNLAAAAPDLAATVAWLYGREPDYDTCWDGLLQVSVTPYGEVALYDNEATTTYLTPDEAVDLARALLAAAEEVHDE